MSQSLTDSEPGGLQPSLQPLSEPGDNAAAPTQEPATAGLVEAAFAEAERRLVGRRPDGTFALGNTESVKHGAYSNAPAFVMEREQRCAEVFTDLGGRDACSAVLCGLVARYAETSAIADWLGANLAGIGPLTAKGKCRAALNAYLQVLDRQHRLAVAIGLERRAKRTNLDDYVADRYPTGGAQ